MEDWGQYPLFREARLPGPGNSILGKQASDFCACYFLAMPIGRPSIRLLVVSLLAVDTAALLVVVLLRIYRVTVISVPLLFAGNLFVLWFARRHFLASAESPAASKTYWLPTIVFTLAAIVAITAFAAKPSIYTASEAGIGILLAGYCWYINYRTHQVHQKRLGEPPRKA